MAVQAQGKPPLAPSPRTGGAAAIARSAANKIAGGALLQLPLRVRFWDGSEVHGDAGQELATLSVHDPSALAYLVRCPNQLGLARTWATGGLDVEGELEDVVALRARVEAIGLSAKDRIRLAWCAMRLGGRRALLSPPRPDTEARPRGRLHSLGRDRHAIGHHYDISNRFYELLLGPSLVYSAAAFALDDEPLESAQERKLESICTRLRLQPDERLLDIGCGWGSLLLHAARHHGARGVGITLSDAQAELARRRVRESGLSDQIEIRITDYRTLRDGPFDKIASIGMYEHVGLANYVAYARKVRSLLREGGLFLNDGIARLFSAAPRRPTFISRYVFPEGELHPLGALVGSIEQAGLEPREVSSTREHYARTLRRWYKNLQRHRAEAEAEIGSERLRVWQLYILVSALGFDDAEISNYQVLAERSS
jgi:cyclopropane-fatty-acyl-phospholipid synthase